MPLKFNDKLIAIDLPTYNVTVLPSSNGSVTATPSSGVPGTIVSLSNTPDEGYEFDEYQITGSSLIDGDKFMIKKTSPSVQGNFILPVQRWEKTIFESSNGVSSGTVSDAFRNFDMIGVRVVSGVDPEYARARSGASWHWINGADIQADTCYADISWASTNTLLTDFFNFQFKLNMSNTGLTFSTAVSNTSISNRLYTSVDNNATISCNNTNLSYYLNCISKIVGVKLQ